MENFFPKGISTEASQKPGVQYNLLIFVWSMMKYDPLRCTFSHWKVRLSFLCRAWKPTPFLVTLLSISFCFCCCGGITRASDLSQSLWLSHKAKNDHVYRSLTFLYWDLCGVLCCLAYGISHITAPSSRLWLTCSAPFSYVGCRKKCPPTIRQFCPENVGVKSKFAWKKKEYHTHPMQFVSDETRSFFVWLYNFVAKHTVKHSKHENSVHLFFTFKLHFKVDAFRRKLKNFHL